MEMLLPFKVRRKTLNVAVVAEAEDVLDDVVLDHVVEPSRVGTWAIYRIQNGGLERYPEYNSKYLPFKVRR